MSSLADDLLADLESDDEQIQEEQQVNDNNNNNSKDAELSNTDLEDPASISKKTQESLDALKASTSSDVTAEDLISRYDFTHISDIQSVSTLMNSLSPVLNRIQNTQVGDPSEYALLVEANSYAVEIDNEIKIVHQFIKQNYNKRFPELQSFVQTPIEYAKTVFAIGNNVKCKLSELPMPDEKQFARIILNDGNNDTNPPNADVEMKNSDGSTFDLRSILPAATFMVITMSAYESKGVDLTPEELSRINSACELLISLSLAKKKITEFVSTRLAHFAPNLTAIVGAHTAAQLLGFVGGIKNLASTPNSNIPALGANVPVKIGFGHTGIRHQGFLYHSPIIQSIPPEYRIKAMRMVSGKLILAARIDYVLASTTMSNGQGLDDSKGQEMKKQLQEKLEKLLEPPENKGPKALPAPIDKPSKKRGGRRIRKLKEQFKPTELQRTQNRVTFGVEEAYDPDLADLGGRLGSAPTTSILEGESSVRGRIRNVGTDSKTKAKMSKSMAARLQQANNLGASNNANSSRSVQANNPDLFSNGMASTLNFSHNQGIELVNPALLNNKNQEKSNDKWFKSGVFSMIPSANSKNGIQLGPPPVPNSNGNGNKRALDLPTVPEAKRSKQ